MRDNKKKPFLRFLSLNRKNPLCQPLLMREPKEGLFFFRKLFFIILALSMLAGCAVKKEKIQTVFYPMPPQTPKLQFLTSITGEEDIGKKKDAFKEFLVGKTQSIKQIARPFGISSLDGKIYISDRTYKKIIVIDLEKKEFDYLRTEKSSALEENAGIWITENGDKFIADYGRQQIVLMNSEDKVVRAYGEDGQFSRPLDVAVYEDKIYVCDGDKGQIIILDMLSGETIGEIGKIGSEEGLFYKPSHIVLDKAGNIYVTDAFNYRVQKFDSEGTFLKVFGYQGDTLGGFARPKGIAVDDDGHLYAVDTAFENVQIFDDESTSLLLYFGGYGPAPGSMYMPNSIYIDYKNVKYFQKYVDKDFRVEYLVYVGNMLGDHKLNVYGFGKWTGDPLPGIKRENPDKNEKSGKK